jgi:hypothetical protein
MGSIGTMTASEPPVPPEVDFHRPAWWRPPDGVVPGVVPVELVLARTPERALGLTGIRAYPNGFGFSLHLRFRHAILGEQRGFGVFGMFGDGVDPAGELADYYLRFGVGFADGRKATNLEQDPNFEDHPAPPKTPSLRVTGREGYDILAHDVDLWVAGLPPPGPLAFVCEWPARGIPESRVEIEASLVLEAAARSVPIWPDEAAP